MNLYRKPLLVISIHLQESDSEEEDTCAKAVAVIRSETITAGIPKRKSRFRDATSPEIARPKVSILSGTVSASSVRQPSPPEVVPPPSKEELLQQLVI